MDPPNPWRRPGGVAWGLPEIRIMAAALVLVRTPLVQRRTLTAQQAGAEAEAAKPPAGHEHRTLTLRAAAGHRLGQAIPARPIHTTTAVRHRRGTQAREHRTHMQTAARHQHGVRRRGHRIHMQAVAEATRAVGGTIQHQNRPMAERRPTDTVRRARQVAPTLWVVRRLPHHRGVVRRQGEGLVLGEAARRGRPGMRGGASQHGYVTSSAMTMIAC